MMYYWISAIGLSFILKYSLILNTFRAKTISIFPILETLYKCCLCMGFWIGVSFTPIILISSGFDINIILFPFSASGICWIADSVLTLVHSLTILVDKIEKE